MNARLLLDTKKTPSLFLQRPSSAARRDVCVRGEAGQDGGGAPRYRRTLRREHLARSTRGWRRARWSLRMGKIACGPASASTRIVDDAAVLQLSLRAALLQAIRNPGSVRIAQRGSAQTQRPGQVPMVGLSILWRARGTGPRERSTGWARPKARRNTGRTAARLSHNESITNIHSSAGRHHAVDGGRFCLPGWWPTGSCRFRRCRRWITPPSRCSRFIPGAVPT